MTVPGLKAGTRPLEVPALAEWLAGGRVEIGRRKEVIPMLTEIVLFILSALGLFVAGKEFLRRGRNLGLWDA